MKIIFACSFLNAKIIKRRKSRPLGMNVPYEWRITDFEACLKTIKFVLDNSEVIQWDMIYYMVTEICYGGRVLEDFDRRLMN